MSSIESPQPPHKSRGARLKQYGQRFIGYDPAVQVPAASTANVFKGATHDLRRKSTHYVSRLFPFTGWIAHYNLTWALGDCIAGLTVGIIVIPQSMSYARIATLPAEYGLYSSFVGCLIYAVFATSKDVTIGPVAVMSLEVSKVIARVQEGTDAYTAPEIATALAFTCGFIVLGIGLLRLGWLVEFIPAPAVSGFMSGSAITILAGQVPALMGYANKFNTREAPYKVIINSFKHLPDTQRDAAFGLSTLLFLYVVRAIFSRLELRLRTPKAKKLAFFANTLRSAVAIIFVTLFSWVYLRNKDSANYPIRILGTVPSGFQHMGQPVINTDLLGRLGPLLPVSTIILLLEHIAIAKSFGRINSYKIDPNQELIAMGVANTLGTVFGAYPATGSFSRSAVKSKAGVRTPLAGWITALVVIVAIYGLTGAFYWIPNAGLAAIIIHAVGDLIASPQQIYKFWAISPFECIIWWAAVITTVFSTVENGIYVSVGMSVALLLYRIARPRGQFLGRVRIHSGVEDAPSANISQRDVYVPLNPDGIRNPQVRVDPPPPGVAVYRFEESLLFPNASYYVDHITHWAEQNTRSGRDYSNTKPGDRPWNDPGEPWWKRGRDKAQYEGSPEALEAQKPVLRALVLDFSSVSNVDSSSLQNLIDLRRVLERYAGREVEFHFAQILSPWIKRALLAGGFGTGEIVGERPLEVAPVVFAHGEPVPVGFERRAFSPPTSPPNGPDDSNAPRDSTKRLADLETGLQQFSQKGTWSSSDDTSSEEAGPVVSTLHSRFHLDLPSAVAAAAGGQRW